jgi:hypothetical protein
VGHGISPLTLAGAAFHPRAAEYTAIGSFVPLAQEVHHVTEVAASQLTLLRGKLLADVALMTTGHKSQSSGTEVMRRPAESDWTR